MPSQLSGILHQLAVTGTAHTTHTMPLSADFAERSLSEQVLLLSGIQHAQQQGGVIVSQLDMTPPPRATPDLQAVCSYQVINYLTLIIQWQNYQAILPEFFRLMQLTGQQIPPELLPAILNIPRRNRTNNDCLIALIGSRYRWLIDIEPDFRVIQRVTSISLTESAHHNFGILRDEQPTAARDHLATIWQTLDRHPSYAYFRILLNHLSLEDEPFLNAILLETQDSALRDIIIDLLTELPDSQFMQQLTAFMNDILSYDADNHIIRLQDNITHLLRGYSLLQPFCVNDFYAQYDQIMIQMLTQLAGYLHPAHFCEKWSLTLPELLSAVWAGDAHIVLFSAWVEVIHRTPDADAALILLEEVGDDLKPHENINLLVAILVQKSPGAAALHKLLQKKKKSAEFMLAWVRACFASAHPPACYDYLRYSIEHKLEHHPRLAKHLSVTQCRELVLLVLNNTRNPPDKNLLGELLNGCGDDWDMSFAGAFITALRRYFYSNRISIIDVSFGTVLMQAAYCLPLALASPFIKAIVPAIRQDTAVKHIQEKIEDKLDDYRLIFYFRAGLHHAITGTLS